MSTNLFVTGAIQTAAEQNGNFYSETLSNKHQAIDKPVDIKWLIKGKEPTVQKMLQMVSFADDPISAYVDLGQIQESWQWQHRFSDSYVWKTPLKFRILPCQKAAYSIC